MSTLRQSKKKILFHIFVPTKDLTLTLMSVKTPTVRNAALTMCHCKQGSTIQINILTGNSTSTPNDLHGDAKIPTSPFYHPPTLFLSPLEHPPGALPLYYTAQAQREKGTGTEEGDRESGRAGGKAGKKDQTPTVHAYI